MSGKPERKCEFCDKRGLPLLLGRYAIARQGDGAPEATGLAIPLSGKAAHYTRRLLRKGYLYVFDEARDRWECWYVTPDGYYFKIDETPGKPIVLPAKPFNCPDVGHREVASCITVRDPLHATNVWLAFSDVRWTAAVRKKHESAAYRKRHMRMIDVQAAMNGALPDFCKKIADVGSTVAEYALPADKGHKVFQWGPFPFNARADQVQSLVKKCDQLRPRQGLIVFLQDPAGIAQELAMLMRQKAIDFGERAEYKRGVEVNGVIEQMEMAIKDMAHRDALRQADIDAARLSTPMGPEGSAGGIAMARLFNKKLDDTYTALEEEARNPSAAQLKKAADEEWGRYTAKFHDKDQREPWVEKFNAALKAYDADFIAPLATAHAAWMKSKTITEYFVCNFDTTDITCGDTYTQVIGDCIASTVDKQACFQLNDKWFCGNPTDNTNLLMRALVYNQDDLAEQIEAAADSGVGWAVLPWDKLINAQDQATKALQAGRPDTLGRLIGMIAGPIAKNLRVAAEGQKVYAGLVAVGLAAKQPIVPVRVEGSRKAFRAAVIRQLLKLSGQPLNEKQMRKAVSDELRILKAQGVPLEGKETKRWLLMIDPEQMKNMPKGLKPSERAQWAAKSIMTIEKVDELNLSAYRLKVQTAAGAVRGTVPFAFGILGIVANWVALDSLQAGDAKTLQQDKTEQFARIQFQRAQLIGAVSGVVELGLGRMPASSSAMMSALSRIVGTIAARSAAVFGVGGAFLMAAVDLWRANEERKAGNLQAGIAYAVSGVLGGLATYFLFLGATGWGLIFVALMFIWAFVMVKLTDNKLQDWLERCCWGKLKDERYPDIETEMNELEVAMR